MSEMSLETTPQEQRRLERFYFHEARLLDNREYQQWLALVTPEVQYIMPSRTNLMVNNRERGNEHMISVARELEQPDSMGCPIREETYVHLMVRVERAFKVNSWGENPPARTRRMVGNVELMARGEDGLEVLSNFHLFYARPGTRDFLYSGQRRDRLVEEAGGFKVARREIVLDYSDIDYPTLGLLF